MTPEVLRERVAPTLVAALALALAGCGATGASEGGPVEAGDGSGAGSSAGSGAVPTTPGALAWLAAAHLGPPDSAAVANGFTYRLRRGAVGTDLRYHAGPGEDGDLVELTVSPGRTEGLTCPDDATGRGGCAVTTAGTVHWERTVPDQDAGMISVYVARGGATVRVYASVDLHGDPRRADVRPSLAALVAAATDPRVGLTTTADAVAAGRRLPSWDDHAGPTG